MCKEDIAINVFFILFIKTERNIVQWGMTFQLRESAIKAKLDLKTRLTASRLNGEI
jgi:hypothetical protein